MISAYLEHLKAQGYSKSTIAAAKRWLEHLERHFNGLILKADDLTAFGQSLRWQPGPQGKLYAENSVNQAVDVVRRFYRWAAFSGLVANDPAAHLTTRRVGPKVRRVLSASEARKLLGQPDLGTFHGCRDRAILGLVTEARISAGALSRLELEHFQTDTAALLVSGRKREILSLSEGLLGDLSRYLAVARPGVATSDEQALFVSSDGRRLSSGAFRQVVAAHAKRAGVCRPPFSS